MKTPSTISRLAAKFAITLALIATPFAALSLSLFESGATTVAGSTLPTDVDPG